MSNDFLDIIEGKTADERLQSLTSLRHLIDVGEIKIETGDTYVNNHIHTTYSFSPYSPTRAVWEAKKAGLLTAGIVDHDSVSGAEEFVKAGKILDMKTTVGCECRITMAGTPFADKRLNNTDQLGIAYVAMHGIPASGLKKVEAFLAPYREQRELRNRKMVGKINGLFGEGFLDYDNDVRSLSMAFDGGSVTERHLMFALAKRLMKEYGKGESLVRVLEEDWQVAVKGSARERLSDENNAFYDYDLLSLLKGAFVSKIYVNATDECPDIDAFISLADEIGAIPAYAYLGDVKNSVTGDKLDMKFEDDYIDELFAYLADRGFKAVTYMPSRNTQDQLDKIRELCDRFGFFQISGEDINSPRQSFICEKLSEPSFSNLVTSTWALIGHEKEAGLDTERGMFSSEVRKKYPAMDDRVVYFAELVQR